MKTIEVVQTTEKLDVERHQHSWLYALLTGTLTLAACLYYQLSFEGPRMFLMLDSGHFLWTTSMLYQHFVNFSHSGIAGNSILGDAILQDGPMLSLLPALLFAILGKEPVSANWVLISVIQCSYQALSAVLVYALTTRILNSSRWGLFAGLAWGLNPAAIVCCGRFLTEGLAHLLLLAAMFFSVESIRRSAVQNIRGTVFFSVLSGIFQGLLLLTKAPLLIALAFFNLISCAGLPSIGKRAGYCFSVMVGVALALAPWVVFVKTITGDTHLIPKRCAVHNLVKGLNYEADAWQGCPIPDFTFMFSDKFGADSGADELYAAGVAIISARPLDSLYMSLRKIPRLFSYPWNDFDQSVFGINSIDQIFLHKIVLVMAFLAVLGLLTGAGGFRSVLREAHPSEKLEKPVLISAIVLSVLVGHFVYLPFEAMPRYFYTAMPLVTIFAVLFTFYVWRSRSKAYIAALTMGAIYVLSTMVDLLPHLVEFTKSVGSALLIEFGLKALLLTLTIGAILPTFKGSSWKENLSRGLVVSAIAGCLLIEWSSIFMHKVPREWKSLLSPGQKVVRQVYVTEPPVSSVGKPRAAALLIDSDKGLEKAKIFVNDRLVLSKPYTVSNLNKIEFENSTYKRIFSSAKGFSFDDLRQWRVVEIPVDAIKYGAVNKLVVQAGSTPVSIFGDYEVEGAKYRHPPQFAGFSPDKLMHNPFHMDGRHINFSGIRTSPGSSYLEGSDQDLSVAPGLQTGEFRILIGVDFHGNKFEAAHPQGPALEGLEPWVYNLGPEDFDPIMSMGATGKTEHLRVSKSILAHSRSTSTTVGLPELLKGRLEKAGSIALRLKGKLRNEKGCPYPSSLLITLNGKQFHMALPRTPYALAVSDGWKDFEIADTVPCSAVPGGLKSVSVALFPAPWEMVSIYGVGKKAGNTSFRDMSLEIAPGEAPLISRFQGLYIR